MDEQTPKKQMGCFAKGCLVSVIVVVVLVAVGGVGGWWIYGKALDRFTSDRPANVAIDEPNAAVFQQAEIKLERLRSAVRNKTSATVEFSAADLNALIARDPAFAGIRGKTRVNMMGYEMILDLSAPLDHVPLPRFKGRWFNGRAQFSFTYDLGEFSFTANALEANGHRMEGGGKPGFNSSVLQSFSRSYTRAFNEGFHKGEDRSAQGHGFWDRIKTMSIQNDQLVVVTQAG